jgi:hypothetical protein
MISLIATAFSQPATNGIAWTPVVEPTVVSIHSLTGMVPDTLHITHLDASNSRQNCGGLGAPLLVFYDHGVPVSNIYAPAGSPTGFVEVYYDRDSDGVPDGTVWALDLASQTDVWITWGLQNDLTFRYLRPRNRIAIAGLPLQTVYYPTQKSDPGPTGCGRDPHARRGGHQGIWAYTMTRVW